MVSSNPSSCTGIRPLSSHGTVRDSLAKLNLRPCVQRQHTSLVGDGGGQGLQPPSTKAHIADIPNMTNQRSHDDNATCPPHRLARSASVSHGLRSGRLHAHAGPVQINKVIFCIPTSMQGVTRTWGTLSCMPTLAASYTHQCSAARMAACCIRYTDLASRLAARPLSANGCPARAGCDF